MIKDSPQAAEVQAALNKLIHDVSAKQYDILDQIYHDDMRIYMLAGSSELQPIGKPQFIAHIIQATDAQQAPNTWAKYHLVEADDTHGHVVISRKVKLTGEEQLITLSIDFIFEDSRWQITREVIFIEQPSE
jgi:hypothetical protein